MGRKLMAGICALALLGTSAAFAAPKARKVAATRCASTSEVTAIQAQVVQQQLMVAALTCGQIANFNAFQTSFRSEMVASDGNLMRMFKRLGKGSAGYHLFKTNLANKFSIKSIRARQEFCDAVVPVFAAALAPVKPTLREFVGGVQVEAVDRPVESCDIQVAVSLAGTQAAVIVPTPNPRWIPDPNALPLDQQTPAAPVTVTR